MSGADTATGVCSRHRGMPVLSRCVACGRELCSKCIVRTPVGFKCSTCTGGADEPAPSNRRPHELLPDTVEHGSRRTVIAIVAVAVALVAVALGGNYLLSRPSGRAVSAAAPVPAATAAPTDVPVQFTGAPGHQLSGDLVLPARAGAAVPGVVIVPDWGSVDRNGMTPAGTLPDPLYADLAQSLAAKNVATLRYDPAGQGQSQLPQGSPVRFEDLVRDADAALHLLAGRVGIDPTRLTVVGHGWGGLAALQLATENHQVSRLVLVSTPGRPVVDTIADQLQAGAVSPADAQLAVQQLRQAVTGVLAGQPFPDPASLETPLRPILPKGQETYLRAIFGLDPAALAQQAHVPTLIVRGALDPALTTVDVQRLVAALGPATGVVVAAQASRTLSITSKIFASGPTTVPTPNGGMQNVHLPATITITRDDATLVAIVDWLLGGPAGSSG